MIAVTKLIDILDKPALVHWANKIGLKGTSLKEYRKTTSKEGSNAHNKIELFLKKGIKFEGCELLEKSLKGFKVVGVEKEIKNDFLIGLVDLILKKEGELYIVDFKRNKNIYLSTKLQLSCYKHMLNADKICYINYQDFKIVCIDINTIKYYEIIKRLYQIHVLLKQLKEKL